MRVVFDDQQHGVVRLQVVTVVLDRLGYLLRHTHRRGRAEAKYLGGAGSAALSTADTLTTDGPT